MTIEEDASSDAIGGSMGSGRLDAGAAAIAGLVLGGISLLFLGGSQFVIGAYGLHGSFDPRDPLTITSIGQLLVALVALAIARYGRRESEAPWQHSVAGAGVVVALVSTLISVATVAFVVSR